MRRLLLLLIMIVFIVLCTACRTGMSDERDVTKKVDDTATAETEITYRPTECTVESCNSDEHSQTVPEVIQPDEVPIEVYEPWVIGDQFEDYFCCNKTLYVRVSPDELYDYNKNYEQREELGEILYNEKREVLEELSEFAASELPIGTKLYRTNYYDIILAECEESLVPYLAHIEG